MEEAEDGYDKNEEAGHPSLLRNPGTLPASRSSVKEQAFFQRSAIYYLSGSPWALHDRISEAFDRLGLPHGAMILRRYSQEPLNPYDFKHPHLLEIVDANPGYKWILFGDTGEKDPEVYRRLIQERPGIVEGVFIHNVTDADQRNARFADFAVFNNSNEVVVAIQQRRLRSRASGSDR